MRTRVKDWVLLVVITLFAALSITAGAPFAGEATASESDPTRPIAVNQTDGFGNDRLVAFTYFMNFACIHEPFDDLDNNGQVAAVDPDEFQMPHCEVGQEPSLDPTGAPIGNTEPLFVIVPFFDADRDEEAALGLAPTLKALFGFVPDAFDPTPGVPVQCPEPGPPLTQHKGEFGTCTMHPIALDLGPVLHALLPDKVPAGTVVTLPTPNHSHVIDGANFGAIWWQVRVVLVFDQGVWPGIDGTTGINSVAALRAAQAAGKASADVPTNFFLFFDSREFTHAHH